MAVVRIPTPLRHHIGGARSVNVEGSTLEQALEQLTRRWPDLRPRVFDADGQVHPFVNLFVDGEDVRLGSGLQTPLKEDSEIAVIPAMAGGASAGLMTCS